MEEKQFVTGISLNQRERLIVDEFRKSKGLRFSPALRVIINEWSQMRKEYVKVPVITRQK